MAFEMSPVCRFSLITVNKFLHKCQPKEGRGSNKVKDVNVVKECPLMKEKTIEQKPIFSRVNNELYLAMDFLIYGQISSFCPDQPKGKLLTLIILHKLTQSL